MTMPSSSRLPWNIDERDDHLILDADNFSVSKEFFFPADVDLVVRAVNCHSQLVEALNAALERIAHRSDCGIIRPSEEWAEHGSVSFEHCTCEVQQVKSALAAAQEAP